MDKPTNPNVIVPAQFAVDGAKTDFSNEKLQNGFDNIAPDILAGDNLNKFIDDTYKSINYSNAGVADLYRSAVIYDNNETYGVNSLIFNVDGNGNTTFYRSLVANNTGNPLNDTNYWQQIQLGSDILDIVMPIGHPKFALDNVLPNNCVWLEGGIVSRTTYVNLFNKWGTTYGAGDGSTTFGLPDARKRAFYGDTGFGYITEGLPNLGLSMTSAGGHNHNRGDMNITGGVWNNSDYSDVFDGVSVDGAFSGSTRKSLIPDSHVGIYQEGCINILYFNAALSWTGNTSWNGDHTHNITSTSGLIGATNKILTDGLKVRVYCRYQ